MNTFIIIVGILLITIIIALALAFNDVKKDNKNHLKNIEAWKHEYQRLSEMYQLLSKDLANVSEQYTVLTKELASKEVDSKEASNPDILQQATQPEKDPIIQTNNLKKDSSEPGKPSKRTYKKRKRA